MKLAKLYFKEAGFSIFLLVLPFLLPKFEFGNLGTLVTPTSALFAIVAGFFIADAMANYLRLQTLISEENAVLMTIAEYVRRVGRNKSKPVWKAIDHYMIAQLDLDTLDYVVKTHKEMDELNEAIETFVRSSKTKSHDHLIDLKERIHFSRQEILLTTKETLSLGHWFTLIIFGGLTAAIVLALRDGSLIMNVTAGLMNVGIFTVLVLLREIDNNHLLENKLSYRNPGEVFHAISQPPYYPSFSPRSVRLPNEKGLYRVGEKADQGKYGFVLVNTTNT